MSLLLAASEISRVIDLTKRGVCERMRGIPHDGTKPVRGRTAHAWAFTSLPEDWQQTIAQAARKAGHRNIAAHLAEPPQRWEPPIPWKQIRRQDRDEALKLQEAMRPVLERVDDMSLSESDFRAIGLRNYKAVFRKTISERRWLEKFKTIVRRDGGEENWLRPELYLCNHPRREGTTAQTALIESAGEFDPIAEVIRGFKDVATPSQSELDLLWATTCETFHDAVEQGAKPAKLRKRLVDWLLGCLPDLAQNANGLRQQLGRRYKTWLDGDGTPNSVTDKRRTNSGRRRGPDFDQETVDKIVGHAVLHCDGRVAQAWRELLKACDLPGPILEYYLSNPSRKSHVPKRVTDLVSQDVRVMHDIHRGPKTHRSRGAFIDRDWSKVAAGDWYTADDLTAPVYYYEPDGEGWVNVMRGQILLVCDCRTEMCLGFVLISAPGYTARAIRTLFNKVFTEWGLPRKGLHLENGIWRSSKLLSAQAKAPFSSSEIESNLRDLGIKFTHAREPRAKMVERVFGALQNKMEGLPGYCGRNEIQDRHERFEKAKRLVESRKARPEEFFMSRDEWVERFGEIVAEFNAESQQGKKLRGLSPKEGWQRHINPDDPPVMLTAETRFLFSHHVRKLRVTTNGVAFHIGSTCYRYKGEKLGAMVDQEVCLFFNPEDPEIAVVTDLNRNHPFEVMLEKPIPGFGATREELEKAHRLNDAQNRYARERYRIIRNHFKTPARRNIVDPLTADLGRQINERTEEAKRIRSEERKINRRINRAASVSGFAPPRELSDSPEKIEAFEAITGKLAERRRSRTTQEEGVADE